MTETGVGDTMDVVHVWAQEYFHCDGFIVGNKGGLLKLKDAIEKALADKNGMAKCEVFVCDGEGYDLHVVAVEGDTKDLATPYVDESFAAENREHAIYPWNQVYPPV